MYKARSPILFLVFNRPKETSLVFNAISAAKPSKLYIAADGPRTKNEHDFNNCNKTKDIINNVNWECEIHTLFRKENLGCKKAVSQAITWFFDSEEEGIILEDDCLPSNDFFRFCDELLERYRQDNRIGHICGCNFQDNIKRGEADYYYSRLTHVWGWASWRRVWLNYDINMMHLEEAKRSDILSSVTDNRAVKKFLYDALFKTRAGLINTWDYQYLYSNIINGYLSIIPNNNLVTNIGFTGEGTHTFDINSPIANLKHQPFPQKITHPLLVVADRFSDTYTLTKEIPGSFRLYYADLKHNVKKLLKKR